MARWYSGTTQIAWVCEMLVQGNEISHACEYEAVKGWRLSAVIHNLDKKYSWPIGHRDGEKNIRFYFLKSGVDASKLSYPKSYKDYLEKKRVLEKEKKGAVTPSSKSDSNNPNPEHSG